MLGTLFNVCLTVIREVVSDPNDVGVVEEKKDPGISGSGSEQIRAAMCVVTVSHGCEPFLRLVHPAMFAAH